MKSVCADFIGFRVAFGEGEALRAIAFSRGETVSALCRRLVEAEIEKYCGVDIPPPPGVEHCRTSEKIRKVVNTTVA
jgi:hypothetical protein